jgi:hypothetical protein
MPDVVKQDTLDLMRRLGSNDLPDVSKTKVKYSGPLRGADADEAKPSEDSEHSTYKKAQLQKLAPPMQEQESLPGTPPPSSEDMGPNAGELPSNPVHPNEPEPVDQENDNLSLEGASTASSAPKPIKVKVPKKR